MKKLLFIIHYSLFILMASPSMAALPSAECSKFYNECMDSFCMIDGLDGGRCNCSLDMNGAAKMASANALCIPKLSSECATATDMLPIFYGQLVKADCVKYDKEKAAAARTATELEMSAMRNARAASLGQIRDENKYDLGGCILETKKCMTGVDACGADWGDCATDDRFDINWAKCEYIQKECVRAAPELKAAFHNAYDIEISLAALRADSDLRQNCLTEISDCITSACADDIAGRGVATMDACLSRPEMAQSFCRVQLDKCTAIEPKIWDFAKARLGGMRIDACTNEVKECLTADDRCGSDYLQCIGLDYAALHGMCPIDKLVVCKANNPKFSFSDLDNMITGIYLNIDNSMLDNCMKLADKQMISVCGSTTDCADAFSDSDFGAQSLAAEKSGTRVSVSGLINWALMDHTNGQIKISEYLENLTSGGAYDRIENSLTDINAEIGRKIELLYAGNPELAKCVGGYDMSNIGTKRKTDARFPHLLDKYLPIISAAGLRRAQINYDAEYNTLKNRLIRESDLLNAEYNCYAAPMQADERLSAMGLVEKKNNYELKPWGGQYMNGDFYAVSEVVADAVSPTDIAKLAGKRITNQARGDGMNVQYDISTTFSPKTRECRTTTHGTMCTAKKYNGDGTGAGIKQILKTIATSCAMGAITSGISAGGEALKTAAVVSKNAKSMANAASAVSKAANALDTAMDVADRAIEAGELAENLITAANTAAEGLRAAEAAAKAAEVAAQAASFARAAQVATNAAQTAQTVATLGAIAGGMSGVAVGSVKTGGDGEQLSMGQSVAFMAANVAVGVGFGATCATISKIFPVGTIVTAAIILTSAVGAATVNDQNFEIECTALDPETVTVKM